MVASSLLNWIRLFCFYYRSIFLKYFKLSLSIVRTLRKLLWQMNPTLLLAFPVLIVILNHFLSLLDIFKRRLELFRNRCSTENLLFN